VRAIGRHLSPPLGKITDMLTDPAERVDLPMVCTCGPEKEATGEALYQRVRAGLSRGSAELSAREVSDRSFVDDLLLSLAVDHGANVESIFIDQWALIVVESGPTGAQLQIVIQADEVSLGLAAVWEWYDARASEDTTAAQA
jgi:hypothetical protein